MTTSADAAPTGRWPGADWPTPVDLSAGLPWHVTVDPLLCAAGDMAFGGFSMALIAEAAQGWTGGRVRSLSVNFLSPVMLDERLTLVPRPLRTGRRVSQVLVDAHVAGRRVMSAAVVLGGAGRNRAATGRLSGPVGPVDSVPPPQECPPRTYRFRKPGSFVDVMDVRLASAEPTPGMRAEPRVLLWGRINAELSVVGQLTVLSDHLPYLIVRALPGVRHATTVSASLRLSSAAATEWTLLDVRLHDVDGEFANGQVRLWSADGALLATADQTTYLVLAD
jgi:acyl-CoA thioesterase